jgi:hypothetical protein
MKRYKYIISLFCLITFISCESDKLDILNYGTINGTVLDAETYLPVSGVLITTTPASEVVLSDENGKFTILKVLKGDVAVNIKRKDYLSNSLSVAIYENQHTQMNFLIFKDDSNIGSISIYDPVPGNGAVDQNLAITFNWKVEGNNANIQLTYNIYIFESNSTVQKLLGENIDVLQVTTNELKLSTTYYWYVVAKNQGTKVAVSPTWSFKTKDK